MIWNADGFMIWNDLHADSMVSGTVLILNDKTYLFFLQKNYLFIHLFLAVLGFHCCTGFSVVVETKSYSPVVVCGPLLLWALGSRVHGLQKLWHVGSLVAAPGL